MARKPLGLLAPFLRTLKERSGLSVRALARAAGLPNHNALGMRLRRPGHLGLDAALRAATASGANARELKRVRALDALDRGALPIPDGATEQQVQKAMAALEVRCG